MNENLRCTICNETTPKVRRQDAETDARKPHGIPVKWEISLKIEANLRNFSYKPPFWL